VFRVNKIIQDKAQFEGNGSVLIKNWNAVLNYLVCSLWASRITPIYGVASLGKDAPFPARSTLYLHVFQPAEHVNSPWGEY